MMDAIPIVRYEARIHEPEGSPSESGGQPDGQGPPEDAAPSDVVANVLSKTPARDDTRLVGVEKDDEGNPQGTPPREYGVSDEIDEETGDRVVRGQLPVEAQADAEALLSDVEADLKGADEYEGRAYLSPTGGVTRSEVEAWYEAHPDQQPTDDDGESFIPSSWDPEHHIEKEV